MPVPLMRPHLVLQLKFPLSLTASVSEQFWCRLALNLYHSLGIFSRWQTDDIFLIFRSGAGSLLTFSYFSFWCRLTLNLYHSLGIFSRWQTDDIFLIFPRKQDLTFQANCLLRRQFAWNVKSCFLGKIFFLFFPENRIWHFKQIVSWGDNLLEMSKPVFWEKIRKIFQNVVCWKFYPEC